MKVRDVVRLFSAVLCARLMNRREGYAAFPNGALCASDSNCIIKKYSILISREAVSFFEMHIVCQEKKFRCYDKARVKCANDSLCLFFDVRFEIYYAQSP